MSFVWYCGLQYKIRPIWSFWAIKFFSRPQHGINRQRVGNHASLSQIMTNQILWCLHGIMHVSNYGSSFIIAVCDLDSLTIPANAKVSNDKIDGLFFHGSSISIACDDKYKLEGSGNATCNNGTWDESDIGVCNQSRTTEISKIVTESIPESRAGEFTFFEDRNDFMVHLYLRRIVRFDGYCRPRKILTETAYI